MIICSGILCPTCCRELVTSRWLKFTRIGRPPNQFWHPHSIDTPQFPAAVFTRCVLYTGLLQCLKKSSFSFQVKDWGPADPPPESAAELGDLQLADAAPMMDPGLGAPLYEQLARRLQVLEVRYLHSPLV